MLLLSGITRQVSLWWFLFFTHKYGKPYDDRLFSVFVPETEIVGQQFQTEPLPEFPLPQ
jgi:hypothetical protein